MLKAGDKIGLICCSDGKRLEEEPEITKLVQLLKDYFHLQPILAPTIFQKNKTVFSGTPMERAQALMTFYNDFSIKMIFDLSGGDSANSILTHLDYTAIEAANKPFVGYSDLTVVLNAVFTQTGSIGYNYQLSNLLKDIKQKNTFQHFFMDNLTLEDLNYTWLTEPKMVNSIVIGGNIRCMLKLAGTPYWPTCSNFTLLLEARGGKIEQISCYLNQLEQTGIMQSCQAILLGQFTTIESENQESELIELLLYFAKKYNFSVIKTKEIGHSTDSLPFPIGQLTLFS
ncbi:LD-carboxypeptidase [Carnobacterium funditum]|uniref:LD-carboxypeptidase n=1 Tax=Carnobacterium funditum TaxID=2752 RepID=UPI000554726C|nr:LD-carboxypeptidase [Carnobacterium funditum]